MAVIRVGLFGLQEQRLSSLRYQTKIYMMPVCQPWGQDTVGSELSPTRGTWLPEQCNGASRLDSEAR